MTNTLKATGASSLPDANCPPDTSLIDVHVQPLGVERGPQQTGAAGDLAASPQTESSSVALKSPEPASQILMRVPGWKRALDLTLIAVTYPLWLPLMLLVMRRSKFRRPAPFSTGKSALDSEAGLL